MYAGARKTIGIILLIASGLTPVLADPVKRDQTRTLAEVKPECGVRVTMVAFESNDSRQVDYCTWKGEVFGRAEFVAGCAQSFRVDGVEYPISGEPDAFGIVVMNLDQLQAASVSTVADATVKTAIIGGM